MDNKALVETLKTIARALYFGLLGIIVLTLTVVSTSPEVASATVTVPVLNVTLSVGALIVASTAALAKIIDRYIHKSKSELNGIAPSFLQN